MRKLKNGSASGAKALVRALHGRWISVTELAEIFGYPRSIAYRKICSLSRTSTHYTLLVKDGGREPLSVLVLPRSEWKDLLHFVALLPKN